MKSKTKMWRFIPLLALAVALLALTTASVLAFDSGGNPGGTGANTITWTGQGASNGVLDTTQCDTTNDPYGANQPYLLWILTVDGGSIQNDSTTPILHLGGSGSGDYFTNNPSDNSAAHFVTPYFTPNSSLTAQADIFVLTTGSGAWNLVISHGCPGVQDLTVSKTATPSFTRTFKWSISKDVDATKINIADGGSATFNYTVNVTHDSGTDSGWMVSGSITVHNPNSVDATNVDVTDSLPGGNCSVTNGTGLTVAAGGDKTVDYSCTFTSNPGSGTNTATATWNGNPYVGTAGFDFTGVTPTIVNGSITVMDDKTDPTNPITLGTASYTQDNPIQFTYSLSKSGVAGTCTDYTNTASIKDTNKTASKTVTVCVGKDLTVSKTATPSFTRTFHWGITKDVDKTLIQQNGGTATFNYTIKVTHDAGVDSAWTVSGKITVNNPNDWEDITANVSDATPGGTCNVTGGTNVNVPKGDKVVLDYSCTFGSNPSTGTNTATATWDKDAAHTPTGAAQGIAGYTFGAPTTIVDGSVNVTDPNAPSSVLPATVLSSDPSPKTFTYSKTVNVPTNDVCTTVNNTATFTTNSTGTTDSASQTVKVCGIVNGGLTMGFWQNKNGQGIITGQATTGVCPSATWLRQFAPFQDLSATAKCTDVATYVTNIIKAANASGASMNAMLKAQMLATALDVYFSDPALGGNKINAPIPLGGVKVDLTKICKMIDGSGGTAACSGVYQNVSAAFNNQSSMTISAMLAWAASQSNVGGSTWYANVKATQEMAKNAFDAINNQVAFVAP